MASQFESQPASTFRPWLRPLALALLTVLVPHRWANLKMLPQAGPPQRAARRVARAKRVERFASFPEGNRAESCKGCLAPWPASRGRKMPARVSLARGHP